MQAIPYHAISFIYIYIFSTMLANKIKHIIGGRMTLEEFMKSGYGNYWIEEPHLRAYIRKTKRHIGSDIQETLDIANVEIEPEHQSKGLFSHFLKKAENEAKKENRTVFVESVWENRLKNFLMKQGYEIVPFSQSTSFFKKFNEE